MIPNGYKILVVAPGGEILQTVELGGFDLAKPLAQAEVMNEIRGEVARHMARGNIAAAAKKPAPLKRWKRCHEDSDCCSHCGKDIRLGASVLGTDSAIFCSKKCADLFQAPKEG